MCRVRKVLSDNCKGHGQVKIMPKIRKLHGIIAARHNNGGRKKKINTHVFAVANTEK